MGLLTLVVAQSLGSLAFVSRAEIPQTAPPPTAALDKTVVARGAELAAVGDCAACHTASGGKPFHPSLSATWHFRRAEIVAGQILGLVMVLHGGLSGLLGECRSGGLNSTSGLASVPNRSLHAEHRPAAQQLLGVTLMERITSQGLSILLIRGERQEIDQPYAMFVGPAKSVGIQIPRSSHPRCGSPPIHAGRSPGSASPGWDRVYSGCKAYPWVLLRSRRGSCRAATKA